MELMIDKLIFQCNMSRTISSGNFVQNGCKIFSAAIFCFYPHSNENDPISIWQGHLNFVEIEKALLILSDHKVAMLSMKDESPEISKLAEIKIKTLGENIALQKNILWHGDTFFQNFLDGKTFLINRINEFYSDTEKLRY